MGMKYSKRSLGRIWLLVVVLIIAAMASGCYSRYQPKGWSGATVVDGTLFVVSVEGKLIALDTSDGSRLWPDSSLGGDESKVAIYGTPAVGGELVYIGGYSGKVYAVPLPSSGAQKWVYPREGSLEPIVGGVVVYQDKVYFSSSDGRIYTLDAATGDRVRPPFQTGDKIWSTPAIDGETLYIGSLDKKLYALDISDGSEKWHFEAGGAIISTPLVQGDTVYFGSFDGHIYALDAASGSLRWRSEVEASSWFWAKPVVCNEVIYAPSLDGKVYILKAQTGDELREAVDLGSPISSWPVAVDGKVIIASQEGKIYSVDTGGNQLRLLLDVSDSGEEIYAPLAASDGVVYIHAQTPKHDTLYALEVATEEEAWRVSLSSK